MDISLEALNSASLVSLRDGQREQLVDQLSKMFTRQRDQIDQYVQNPELVSAYTQFYLISNGKKLRFLLEQLPLRVIEELKECSLIDFGCGPGTYGLAWWNHFRPENKIIWEVDQAELMLEQSKKIIQSFADEKVFRWKKSIRDVTLSDDLCLLFGNSMNEMKEKELLDIIDSIKAKFLIFIEPGTKEVFNRMRSVRSTLIEQRNFSVLYPCLGQAACPMDDENWCHQVIRAQYAQDYESFCQRLKKDRRSLPVSLYMFQRNTNYFTYEENMECARGRVIRLLKETKYSLIFEICIEQMGKNILQYVEILKRDYKKREIKQLMKFDHGRHFYFQYVKQKEKNLWVIELVGDVISEEL